jgi:peptide methionine sulfoxide reductase msrA/msrB
LIKNPGGYCHIDLECFERAKGAIVNPEEYSLPSEEEVKRRLSDLEYQVTRQNGTEPAYQNEYYKLFSSGIYVDLVTGEPLFTSADKFDACGWPSFSKPIDPSVIRSKADLTHGMVRQEVRSRVGNIHLGHVFDDGPIESGGLRYCINSAALRFIPKEEMEEKGYGKYLYLVDKG